MAQKITVNEFRVERLNMGQRVLDLSFKYSVEKEGILSDSRISKRFLFGENVINLIMAAMQEMKKNAGTLAMIDKEEETKEKLVNTMNRIIMEINDLNKIKEHEKYMKSFNRINCYKLQLPEIEINVKK